MGVAEKASNSQTQPAEAVDISGISANQEQISALQTQLEKLTIKFDIAQSQTESVLTTAQTAMQNGDMLLTAITIFIASVTIIVSILVFVFQYFFNKSQAESIERVETTIAKGILPEGSKTREKFLETIFESEEFLKAVKFTNKFIKDGIEARKEWVDKEGTKTEEIAIPEKGFKSKNKN